MNDRNNEGISSSVKRARERAHCDVQARAAAAQEWLDIVIRLALQLAVGNAEPAAAVWTETRGSIETWRQASLTRKDE